MGSSSIPLPPHFLHDKGLILGEREQRNMEVLFGMVGGCAHGIVY